MGEWRSGLPIRSLKWEATRSDGYLLVITGGWWIGESSLYERLSMIYSKRLPLIPIWPGFAVNTIFYGAIIWLLIPGPFALRRLIRRRRGLCPACGYPVGESDVCSECGRDLPGRTEAMT